MTGLKQRFAPYQRAGLGTNQSRVVNVRCWLGAVVSDVTVPRPLKARKPTLRCLLSALVSRDTANSPFRYICKRPPLTQSGDFKKPAWFANLGSRSPRFSGSATIVAAGSMVLCVVGTNPRSSRTAARAWRRRGRRYKMSPAFGRLPGSTATRSVVDYRARRA